MNTTRLVFVLALCAHLLLCASPSAMAQPGKAATTTYDIIGAGASFPNPLFQLWIREFSRVNGDFTIFYDSVGSGEGTQRFIDKKVDFGASDSAMTYEQMARIPEGVQLIPITAGSIVLAYNLPGIKEDIRLSREVYADIFLGDITVWNDPRIQVLNPHIPLPKLNIVTVARSDSSGTTWAFSNHLQAISSKWTERGYTRGKKIDWPGTSMASRFNEGVAGTIRISAGSIGYVEYGIAKRAGLNMAILENREKNFIQPSSASGTSALASTSGLLPDDFRLFIPDPDGTDSYPIVTYSWLLLYKSYADPKKAFRIKEFVAWALTHGQVHAASLGYSPLPSPVVSRALQGLKTIN